MTAHTPPTPPAARERKLETVCLDASMSSSLTCATTWVEVESGEEDDEGEGIAKLGY